MFIFILGIRLHFGCGQHRWFQPAFWRNQPGTLLRVFPSQCFLIQDITSGRLAGSNRRLARPLLPLRERQRNEALCACGHGNVGHLVHARKLHRRHAHQPVRVGYGHRIGRTKHRRRRTRSTRRTRHLRRIHRLVHRDCRTGHRIAPPIRHLQHHRQQTSPTPQSPDPRR